MKKYSLFLLTVVLAFPGGQPSFAKKKKAPVLPEVKLKVELDRKVLPAGKTERAVLKISLDPEQVIREEANRPPVNLAIVLDRSGSMSGDKLEQAKEAAIQAIRRMGAKDKISIVAYSNHAEIIASAQSAKDAEKLVNLVRQLKANGGTALFAGVNQGAAELRKNLEGEYFNRIILLSDGLANQGPSSTLSPPPSPSSSAPNPSTSKYSACPVDDAPIMRCRFTTVPSTSGLRSLAILAI